jgi:hypothetical protein
MSATGNQYHSKSFIKGILILRTALVIRFVLVSIALTMLTLNSRAATITWTGASSSDWNTAGNWSPGVVPGVADDVQIGIVTFSNQPVLNNVLLCNTITFGSRKAIVFIINAGAGISVSGSITLQHSEDNLVPYTTITGSGSLTCASLVVGNADPSKIVQVKTTELVSTLALFTVSGNVYVNSTTCWLLSGGIAHNNSLFSLQGGQLTVNGQIKLTNLVPAFLSGNVLSLTPASKFSIDVSSGQNPRLKVLGNVAININNPQWDAIDYYNPLPSAGAGSSAVAYGGASQIIATSSTSGLDTIPQPYDNLIISGTGVKNTESTSGDYLVVGGFLNVTQSTLDLQTNGATLWVLGNFSNAGTTNLSRASFLGGIFTNSNALNTRNDTVSFLGGNQVLNDSTANGTILKNVLIGPGTKTIATGSFIIPSGGNWKMAGDSSVIAIAPNAALIFQADSTGQSMMTSTRLNYRNPVGVGTAGPVKVIAALKPGNIPINPDFTTAARLSKGQVKPVGNRLGKSRRSNNTALPKLSFSLKKPRSKGERQVQSKLSAKAISPNLSLVWPSRGTYSLSVFKNDKIASLYTGAQMENDLFNRSEIKDIPSGWLGWGKGKLKDGLNFKEQGAVFLVPVSETGKIKSMGLNC